MLTIEQAAIAKGLLARGERQQDIAAYFGLNSGRIAELAVGYITRKGHAPKPHPFASVKATPAAALPPRMQMVPWGFIMHEARSAITIAEVGLASARARLNEIEGRLMEEATKTTPKSRQRQ